MLVNGIDCITSIYGVYCITSIYGIDYITSLLNPTPLSDRVSFDDPGRL